MSIPDYVSRASYSDGVLVEPKLGQNPDPKPCAGNDGTTITVRVALIAYLAAELTRS